jgi:hypothetical protein
MAGDAPPLMALRDNPTLQVSITLHSLLDHRANSGRRGVD